MKKLEKIKGWDVIGLVETWVEKKEWKFWKKSVPKESRWSILDAKKENRRWRAKGSIWMGIRKELEGEEGGMEEKGLMIKEIRWEGSRWKVGTEYI